MKYKLIKISDEHYIVVDDSEIKEGDWYLCNDSIIKNYIVPTTEGDMLTNDFLKGKKITHSTQPIERDYSQATYGIQYVEDFNKIKQLSLSEVEEAIYGYSVEKMANTQWGNVHRTGVLGYIDGFKAHQELVKDKMFTINNMKSIFIHGKQLGLTIAGNIRNSSEKPNQDEWFNESIESLLPKTKWDVEINEQGKIKLIN